MSDDDTFGFGDAKKPAPPSLSEKLSSLQPKAAAAETVPTEAIDEVAERRGFRSREAVPPKAMTAATAATVAARRRKGAEGPFVAINTRAPVRFVIRTE